MNCSIEGCVKTAVAKDYCGTHYQRVRRTGSVATRPLGPSVCTIEGCDKPVLGRRWCSKHYDRWRVHGDPTHERTPASRFESKYTVNMATGCWEWNDHLDKRGYGRIYVDGLNVAAHRFAYELHIAPIPPGLEIDHLCRVTRCVNPAHLEPVTPQENLRREHEARRANRKKEKAA